MPRQGDCIARNLKIATRELKVNTSYFPDGTYYYAVQENGRVVKGGTFLVRH